MKKKFYLRLILIILLVVAIAGAIVAVLCKPQVNYSDTEIAEAKQVAEDKFYESYFTLDGLHYDQAATKEFYKKNRKGDWGTERYDKIMVLKGNIIVADDVPPFTAFEAGTTCQDWMFILAKTKTDTTWKYVDGGY